MWRWLDETSTATGAELLAIPHNSNIGMGKMFDAVDSDGQPIDAAGAWDRLALPPVIDMMPTALWQRLGDAHRAYVAPSLKTPAAAIIVYAMIVSALALSGTFATLAVITVAADMLVSTATVGVLYTMWRRSDGGLRASLGPIWIAIGTKPSRIRRRPWRSTGTCSA